MGSLEPDKNIAVQEGGAHHKKAIARKLPRPRRGGKLIFGHEKKFLSVTGKLSITGWPLRGVFRPRQSSILEGNKTAHCRPYREKRIAAPFALATDQPRAGENRQIKRNIMFRRTLSVSLNVSRRHFSPTRA